LQKNKVYDSHYCEMMCDLVSLGTVQKLNRQLFEFTIQGLKHHSLLA